MHNLRNAAMLLAQPHWTMSEQVASQPCLHYRLFSLFDGLGLRKCCSCDFVYRPDWLPVNEAILAWSIGEAL